MEDITDVMERLEQSPDFNQWRKELIEGEIERIDAMKRDALSLSEAEVKAVILYEFYVKELLDKSFARAKEVKKITE